MNKATTVRQPKQEAVAKRKLIYTGHKSRAELNQARVVHSTDAELMKQLTGRDQW